MVANVDRLLSRGFIKPFIFAIFDISSDFNYLSTHEEMWDVFWFTTTFGMFSFSTAPQDWLITSKVFSNRVFQEI